MLNQTLLNQTLANRYKITSALGHGAMGEVYAALDRQAGQKVALKIIARNLSQEPELLQRFRREGEALRQLRHRNIVGFVDMFAWQGQQVIVMEYVPGGSLFARLKRGPLPLARVREISLDLCDALVGAHRLNIIHRDLKPENVLLTDTGTPKLTDFGVARLLGEGNRLTRTGTQVGTPFYMSPEAWAGRPLDQQADVWSLGVMLFEMLAGKVPYGGDTIAAVMNNVLTAPLPDLKTLRPDTSDELVQVVRHALTRDPAQRYKTMRQMAVDIEQCSVPPLTSPEQAEWDAEKTALAAAAGDAMTTVVKPPTPARWGLWAGVGAALAVLLVCAAVGAALLWAGSRVLAPRATPSALGSQNLATAAFTPLPPSIDTAAPGLSLAAASPTPPSQAPVETAALPLATSASPPTLAPTATATPASASGATAVMPVPVNTALPQSPRAISVANAAAVTEVASITTQGGGKVAWSPTGKFFGAASSDGLELYDGATFKPVRTLGDRQWLSDFAFMPDGQSVVVTGADGVTIWRADTGGQVKVLPSLKGAFQVAVTPDGKLLAAIIGQVVKLVDLASGTDLATLPVGSDHCNVAFSPDGRWLATAGGVAGEQVVVYDVASQKQIHALQGHSNGIAQVVFSSDGRMLASASADQTVILWDLTTGLLRSKLVGHTGMLGGVALSPDGTVVASNSWDLTVRLWEAASGQPLVTLTGPTEWAKAIVFSPDGALIASSDFGSTVLIWGLPPGGANAPSATPRAIGSIATAVPVSAKAISADNVASLKQLAVADGVSANQIAFTPDGLQVAASDAGVSFFEPRTLKRLSSIQQATGSFALARDGKRLAAGGQGGITLYQLNGAVLSQPFGGGADAGEMAISPDGALVAAVSGDAVKVWDVASGKEVRTLPAGATQGNVAFSPDGKRLVGAGGVAGEEISVWDTITWQLVYTLKGHSNWISRMVFSPDGQTLASGASDNSIRLWDLTTGLAARTMPIADRRGNQIPDLAFSPDGKLLAASYGVPEISIWEVATGTELRTLTGPTGMTHALAFSPDGTLLVTSDDSLRTWSLP